MNIPLLRLLFYLSIFTPLLGLAFFIIPYFHYTSLSFSSSIFRLEFFYFLPFLVHFFFDVSLSPGYLWFCPASHQQVFSAIFLRLSNLVYVGRTVPSITHLLMSLDLFFSFLFNSNSHNLSIDVKHWINFDFVLQYFT